MKLRRQIAVVSAVVALHGALWWLIRPLGPPSAPPRPERTSVVLVLPRPVDAPVPAPQPDAAEPASRRPVAPAFRSMRPIRHDAVTAGSVTAPGEPGRAALFAEAASAAASQPLRPLDLTLRRGVQGVAPTRNPALDDRRANTTARAAPEARMERRFSQVVHEELREDGSVRITRGDDCVDLKQSRASQLFATDSATRPMPRLASACP